MSEGGGCGSPYPFTVITLDLGAGDDTGRFDAEHPHIGGGRRRVPKSVRGVILGGPGKDTLLGHKGRSKLDGGSGRDTIHADDNRRDQILCGHGYGKAFVDRKDDPLRGCDVVFR